jgi:conjugal transfer pilus assembly protein TraL
MRDYTTFKLADEPKLLGVSVLSSIPAILFTLLGLFFGQALPMLVIGCLIGVFMHLKFAIKGLRYFYSVLYWSLPGWITRIILPNSPDSSVRVYKR